MHRILLVLLASATAASAQTARLSARMTTPADIVPNALIVGRAVCGTSTWLLTEQPQLVEIADRKHAVRAKPVRGLRADDRLWGLACLLDGSLWTLASPHALVRLTPEGIASERVDLTWPRITLFAAGSRLLFQQLPTVVGSPVLATGVPRRPFEVETWPGLIGRAATPGTDQLSHNLANCGIGVARAIPCWFADEARLTLYDGASTRVQAFQEAPSEIQDRTAPIRDAALAGFERLWLLTSVREPDGHRAGGRLTLTDRRGSKRERLDLNPRARLILAASETTCLLLTVRGGLMEVVER